MALVPLTPSISDIRKARLEQPAQVMSEDGQLLAEYKWANRVWMPLPDIAPVVVSALIATEDHRFFDHFGLDWRRMLGAAWATLHGRRQGGSTLTQQLARNLYPNEVGRSPTLNRKFKEAVTALKIEALYSKSEILETYLNTVPFLYNAFGIEMAARTYFDKSASQLDVLEAATLVGMLKGNSYYNPVLNPERALARRNTVLGQMVKRGELDATRYDVLKKRPIRVNFERQLPPTGPAPHFTQQLRQWLVTWADEHDYNIYADGLVVRTTLNARLQALANQAVARQVRQLQAVADTAWRTRRGWSSSNPLVLTLLRETPDYRAKLKQGESADVALKSLLDDAGFMRALKSEKTRVQAGFLVMSPHNGHVLAWVGSPDFARDPFDHVQQARRQPGSTFKPFVYGAAFDKGASPDDTLLDQAVEIALPGGEIWRPTDATPPSGKPVRLRDALAQSKNTITAELMQTVGPARVARLARAMGVRDSKLALVPSLALGASPVTLKEMVSAYGTIANGGSYQAPMLVTRIENRAGEVLAEFSPPEPERALSEAVNYQLLDTLRGVVDKGTATAIRSHFGIRADVAGKTGTTQDNTDGWFILMHPQLVAGAWVGFNDGRITLRSDYWGQGARSALPIVGDFTAQALRARIIDSRARFDAPPDNRFFAPLWARFRTWWRGEPESIRASTPRPPHPTMARPIQTETIQTEAKPLPPDMTENTETPVLLPAQEGPVEPATVPEETP